MTVKSIVRFAIGIFLAALILGVAVPYIGIPRAQLYPPPYIYGNAIGKTKGEVTKVFLKETSDPFHVGEKLGYVEYQFQAAYTPLFLGDPKADPQKMYTGVAQVKKDDYGKYKIGDIVPIRYEKTYPVISGIDNGQGGINIGKGSGLVSGWIGWALGTIAMGYLLAGLLENIILRESF